MMLVLLSGCKRLIEVPGNTIGQITTDQVFADSVSAVKGVVGISAGNMFLETPLSGSVTLYPAFTADEVTSSSIIYAEYLYNALLAGTAIAEGGSSAQLWNGSYKNTYIYAANAALEGLNASTTLTRTLKDQLIGECEVLRALAYFNLVNIFGDVPKLTSSNYQRNGSMARSPVDTIYALIITDLSDAVNRLLPSYPSAQRARPNKYTAVALLAKTCLYKQRWSDAASLASIVIDTGIYQLETDPGDVFLNGSSEAIWQMPGLTIDPGKTHEGDDFIPYSSSIIPIITLTPFLLAAFEPGDQRKTQWTHTVTLNGTSYTYPYKYRNSSSVHNGGAESYMILRLAEQYLIRAEARVQQGNLSGAAQDLNRIRNRAGLPDVIFSGKDDLLRAIMHERQIELFCEWGNRWFDLKRTGTIDSVLAAEKGLVWPADGHGALYPIPADQLRLNPALRQNPGY